MKCAGGDSAPAAAGTALRYGARRGTMLVRLPVRSCFVGTRFDRGRATAIGKLGGVGIGAAPRERLSDETRRVRDFFTKSIFKGDGEYVRVVARRTPDKPSRRFRRRPPDRRFRHTTHTPRTTGRRAIRLRNLFRRPPAALLPPAAHRSRLLRGRSRPARTDHCLRGRGLTHRRRLDDRPRGGVERDERWRVPADASPRVLAALAPSPRPPGPRGGVRGVLGATQAERRLRVFADMGFELVEMRASTAHHL